MQFENRRQGALSLTLFSPSMTITGTEVAGQRCLAGRGLSQFHRTIIWRKEKGWNESVTWEHFDFLQPREGPRWTSDMYVGLQQSKFPLTVWWKHRHGTIHPRINRVTLSGFIFRWNVFLNAIRRPTGSMVHLQSAPGFTPELSTQDDIILFIKPTYRTAGVTCHTALTFCSLTSLIFLRTHTYTHPRRDKIHICQPSHIFTSLLFTNILNWITRLNRVSVSRCF